MTLADTPSTLNVTLMSGWADIASLIAAEVVRLEHRLESHPLSAQDEVTGLIRAKSWSVFIGIWPDRNAATATSIALTKDPDTEVHASELVYCGAGAALIAIRRGNSSRQAKAKWLARSVSDILRQLALQLAYREMGSQPLPSVAPAEPDSAQLGRITRKLNDQLTILVNCAQSILNLVGSEPDIRGFVADLQGAASGIAESSKQLIKIAAGGPPKPSS